MAVNKAGGTNVYASTAPASASALVDFLETNLATAGWTVVSGAGTDAITFRSAATANGSYQMRVITSVSSTRVRLKAAAGDGTSEQSNYFTNLLPDGSSTWYLLANKYAFVVFEGGKVGTSQKFGMAGCLYLPSSISGDSSLQAYAGGDTYSDGNASATGNFRNHVYHDQVTTPASYYICSNGTWREHHGLNATNISNPRWWGFAPVTETGIQSMSFFNGDVFVTDALMAFGVPDTTSISKIQGWFFDTIILHGVNYSELTEVTYDSDTYVVFGGSDGVQSQNPEFCIAFLKPAA